MGSREELLEVCKRILWTEKEMFNLYRDYISMLGDQSIIESLNRIEADEARHINMANRLVAILSK